MIALNLQYAGSSWDELKHIRQAVGFLVSVSFFMIRHNCNQGLLCHSSCYFIILIINIGLLWIICIILRILLVIFVLGLIQSKWSTKASTFSLTSWVYEIRKRLYSWTNSFTGCPLSFIMKVHLFLVLD